MKVFIMCDPETEEMSCYVYREGRIESLEGKEPPIWLPPLIEQEKKDKEDIH